MRHASFLLVLTLLILAACAAEDDGTGEGGLDFVDFPHTVTLGPEQGLVALTGVIFDKADFVRSDLVTYTNQTIKLQTGCEKSQAHCRPLHICRLSPQSKPLIFKEFSESCANMPEEGIPSIVANAETGMGFTIRLNNADGYGRFWVKEVKGGGDAATVTLVYSVFGLAEEE